jgi:SpoVK/Ycf46/Vps4 family AAA+-type ATPase
VAGDLFDAGRALTAPDLSRYAIRIEPRYDWDDLVLGEERMRQLRSVAARVKHRRLVHRDWGFGRKLSRGKGVSVLFSGPSGTGKTMAAEVLANDLSVDLFQIDLSAVVSKYIGETESNLARIFSAAGGSQCLLFFDEADALYGKRTEVKDAHDRYANIEVDYLLQRMEQYPGPVVLATNFQKNIDDAFLRRLHDVVEFPFPDESARQRIWRQHLPEEAPREDDVDFEFLARKFNLTGGSIRNIVVNAAFLAAEEQVPIAMRHLVHALRAEYQKQGKLLMKGDLGRYAEEP